VSQVRRLLKERVLGDGLATGIGRHFVWEARLWEAR
jgi:hypothetical protein